MTAVMKNWIDWQKEIKTTACLTDVMPNAFQLFTKQKPHQGGQLPTWAKPGQTTQLVVWLIDGLGYDQIEYALSHQLMPHLAQLFESQRGHLYPLHTVFPSMTPVALSSLLTGRSPVDHGILGQVIRYNGEMVNILHGPLPDTFTLSTPDVSKQAAEIGISYHAVLEHRLLKGPLTRILHPQTSCLETFMVASGLPVVTNSLLDDNDPGIIYLYWSGVDAINHVRGAYSPEWKSEIQSIDHWIKVFTTSHRKDTWLWITADHGHIPMAGGLPYWDLKAHLQWLPDVPPQVGTAIAIDVDNVADLREFLSQWSTIPIEIVSTMEMWKAGYFGNTKDSEVLSRIGSHLLMPTSGWSWLITANDRHNWSHGGMSASEMIVPWIELSLE